MPSGRDRDKQAHTWLSPFVGCFLVPASSRARRRAWAEGPDMRPEGLVPGGPCLARVVMGHQARTPPGRSAAMADRVMEELDENECLRLYRAWRDRPDRLQRPVRPGRAAGELQAAGGAIVFRTAEHGPLDEELRTGIADADYKVAFEIDDIDLATSAGGACWSRGRPIMFTGGRTGRGPQARASSPGRRARGSCSSGSSRPASPAAASAPPDGNRPGMPGASPAPAFRALPCRRLRFPRAPCRDRKEPRTVVPSDQVGQAEVGEAAWPDATRLEGPLALMTALPPAHAEETGKGGEVVCWRSPHRA